MDEDFGVAIDSTRSIVVENNIYNYGRSRKRYTAWLTVDGKAVSMISYLDGGSEYDVPMLCDIEVKKENRGNALGVTFVKLLEEHVIGGTLYTSGHYTPEGFRSLSDSLPLAPHAVEAGEKPSQQFRSMGFVADWDNLWLEN